MFAVRDKSKRPAKPIAFADPYWAAAAEAALRALEEADHVLVPAEFLEAGTDYVFEVLAIEEGGNQTISEGCFTTAE